MVTSGDGSQAWVLLVYRVPREPSSPRIAIWRRLKRLGVASLGDGLVALPADARTVEALEWVANDVLAAGGTASVWSAEPFDRRTEDGLVAGLRAARAAEYAELAERAAALSGATPDLSDGERRRRLTALRAEARKVHRRDFFPPPERDALSELLRDVAHEVPDGSARAGEAVGS